MSAVVKEIPVEIKVGDAEYVLVPNEENILAECKLSSHGGALKLAVVYLIKPRQKISAEDLSCFRSSRLDPDDVFRSDFLDNIVFYGARQEEVTLGNGVMDVFGSWNVKKYTFIPSMSAAIVRPGPTLEALDAPRGGLGGRVIVPSRCYFNPSPQTPLDGVRISVKDNIHVAGHKTTLCNRAWMDLYPPEDKHAACVQTLIHAGAIIVGKVKLQAMIMGEEPLECVGFTAPFNPRADGYQVPSGSSHGSAAGISSYDWLDFSLGSDTDGSGRKPASYNGCFSIRPTAGILDTEGVVSFFPEFDMPVFFGRDISRFQHFIYAWYGDSPLLRKPLRAKVRILYPSDYLPTENEEQTESIERFISGLESAFQTKRAIVSLRNKWKTQCPAGKAHGDIEAYLDEAGAYPFYYDHYHNLAEFRQMYFGTYGKPPFVRRTLRDRWEQAANFTNEHREECLYRCRVYREWLLEKVIQAGSKDTITVMILPIDSGKPHYRDADPPECKMLPGFHPLYMSPMMRAPEVTAPVGEIPYRSTVTDRVERLPIAVSVLGAPGTDIILADVVERAMKAAGLATEVRTGPQMYLVDDEMS